MASATKKHPVVTKIWVRIEVDPDSGRISGHVGLEGEDEYASVWGAQDSWTTMHALTPYISVLCAGDPFGLIPKP